MTWPIKIFSVAIVVVLMLPIQNSKWRSYAFKKYTYHYTSSDTKNKKAYNNSINKGIKTVELFFAVPFKNRFDVYVHPNRQSLDSTWQKDWQMLDFKSECWMVASGVASRLDMISPKVWDKFACEHSYSDKIKTQQLIDHELVHVFHGQLNASPDFSNVDKIDWFVEGLATYASGQCDTARINEVKKVVSEKKHPRSLDNFWTGKLRYGLSGSVVMYIDAKYGRQKLKELLHLNKKDDLLGVLGVTESELLQSWADYILKL